MKYLFLFIAAALLFGCNINSNCLNKKSFLEGFDKFASDLREHYDDIDKSGWPDIDKEYETYIQECYPKFKEEMTAGEKIDFWKNALGYGVYRSADDDSYDFNLEKLGVDVKGEIESLTASGRAEIEKFIKEEFGPQLENTFDEVLKELEELGDQLKEWLDEL